MVFLWHIEGDKFQMVGNARSGPKRGRRDERITLVDSDRPERPANLHAIEAAYWDEVIATAEHLRKADTSLCIQCCRLYFLHRETEAAARCDPLDKDVAVVCRGYFKDWKAAVERLCLDPLGRERAAARVKRSSAADDESPDIRFFGDAQTG